MGKMSENLGGGYTDNIIVVVVVVVADTGARGANGEVVVVVVVVVVGRGPVITRPAGSGIKITARAMPSDAEATISYWLAPVGPNQMCMHTLKTVSRAQTHCG